jgi:type VI secretion system protein ImpM
MEVGFYGKLPSHGDFVRRRVSDAFVDAWDAWLREGLAESLSSLGERWLDVYLTSPVWRFVCSAGACGPAPLLGLVAPSVDQAGRYFPLTLVSELPEYVSPLTAAVAAAPFFARAEQLVIEMLAAEHVDFERFDETVIGLGSGLAAVAMPPRTTIDPAVVALFDGGPAWRLPLDSSDGLTTVFEQMLAMRLSAKFDPFVLWWTEGSAEVEPSCLVTMGLPRAKAFAALLNGAWGQYDWQSVPAHVAEAVGSLAAVDAMPFRYRSAAATDVGRVRGHNEDGFIERPDVGIWAVADGLGGHSDGEIASRMVCDALADFQPDRSFEETVEAARRRLQEVNDHLLRTAARTRGAEYSGSTVVALFARGNQSAVLWAGDSRVYRWRARRLEQLSSDHSLAALDGLTAGTQSNVVTRAVGVQPALALDVHRDTVSVDDRFLLCSDGLTRVVPEDRIREWMEEQDIRVAVDGLIRTTLEAGAPDNVTVLIVEAQA